MPKNFRVDLSIIGKKTETAFEYNWRDVVLYALGVGASAEDLPFIYEDAPGGLKVLPSFCVVPAMKGFVHLLDKSVDPSRFLHGGQTIRLFRPLPTECRGTVVGEVTKIYDKGKDAVYHIHVSGHASEGSHLFDANWVNFYVGAGGFGGERGPKFTPSLPPEGVEPDYTFTDTISPDQAVLYHLSGDPNPLHLVPEIAKRAGFERPILQGLCTYGFAIRAIVINILCGDVDRFKSFTARFSGIVYPGDTLTVRCWHNNGGFMVQVDSQRGVVMSDGLCELM
jgi:acyl dehydratase